MASRCGRRLMKDEQFEEGEVWGSMEDRSENSNSNSSPRLRKPIKKDRSTLSISPSSTTSRPRMIPRSSSSSINEVPSQTKQFSAPLDIPDWSKIYGKTSKKKNTSSSSSWVHHHHNGYYANDDNDDDDDDHYHYGDDGDGGDGDDEDDGMVPPHEYLARKLARSQISSFSVCEGIGRTLKGRDLSKVRNAILTKTGFLES